MKARCKALPILLILATATTPAHGIFARFATVTRAVNFARARALFQKSPVVRFAAMATGLSVVGATQKDKGPNASRDTVDLHASTFEAVQKIHTFAGEIASKTEAQQNGAFVVSRSAKGPHLLTTDDSTHQGLYLNVADSSGGHTVPNELYTPWGTVRLYGARAIRYYEKQDPTRMLFDQFGQRLQLKFVRNSCENQTVAPVGASAPQFYRDNLNHPIAQIDLERYRGTQTRILAQKRCNCSSLYAIESIDGQALPASVLRSDKILNSKEHEATRKDWDQRLAEYNANKKPNQSTVSSGKTV